MAVRRGRSSFTVRNFEGGVFWIRSPERFTSGLRTTVVTPDDRCRCDTARVLARIVIVLAATTTVARADVDWAKGLVTAEGIGVANRAAPTPAAARGPARRLAEEAAKKQLAAQLGGLPLATGGKLEVKLKDAAVKAEVERAVANALVVSADPETDGSWRVTMGVPIEALRQALTGGPRTIAGADDAPAVIVVDGASVKPAIGYQLGALAAPVVFVKDVPAWAKDAPRVKAKGAKAGVIDVAATKATAATLFVIQTK